MDELLSVTTDKQRRAISSYYLADREVTWQEVGEELGVNYTSLQRTAHNGILRILRHLGR